MAAETWHTIFALSNVAILLEVKSGPFREELGKETALWAPAEGSAEGAAFLEYLRGCLAGLGGDYGSAS